jgi:menaquinone-dependent protoporphyrinogen oxidase
MPDALVVYASVEGHTERIARRIAEILRGAGHRVDVVPAGTSLDWSSHAGVIVGASVHYGHHPAWLARFLRKSRVAAARRSAFFSVSLSANQHYAERFLGESDWTPQLTAVFAGALAYSKYGPIKRFAVRAFAAIAGHDTDTSCDYDYTDWEAVERFATAFSRGLA